jgi:hypothetical protein
MRFASCLLLFPTKYGEFRLPGKRERGPLQAVFSGGVFDFLRNTLLDGRNIDSSGRGKFIQNQNGAILCGPILRERLFFFVDYTGLAFFASANIPEVE